MMHMFYRVMKGIYHSVLSRPPSFGGGITTAGGSTIERRSSRRRRRDRDAEGVERVGNGEGVSPSPAD